MVKVTVRDRALTFKSLYVNSSAQLPPPLATPEKPKETTAVFLQKAEAQKKL